MKREGKGAEEKAKGGADSLSSSLFPSPPSERPMHPVAVKREREGEEATRGREQVRKVREKQMKGEGRERRGNEGGREETTAGRKEREEVS
jgi:hypothetical protein